MIAAPEFPGNHSRTMQASDKFRQVSIRDPKRTSRMAGAHKAISRPQVSKCVAFGKRQLCWVIWLLFQEQAGNSLEECSPASN
jgi:hypothetical protein